MKGFKLIKTERIAELDAMAYLYEHTGGVRLVFVRNKDENRVVMPVFKTIPPNEKGIPHIVEHCTLCGSEKYPMKDPFNLLEKGSIYTYLNAITYQDKTVYPVASTDPEELEKLARVYADAVFKPLMLENEGIFMQEGVYRSEDGINGVVFNEMKGAFASESKLLQNRLRAELYKGCSYKAYSGGVPEAIPSLTYEEFKKFYLSNYGGANCVIYIYGDVNIDLYIKLFGEYLEDEREYGVADDKVTIADMPEGASEIAVKAGEDAKGLSGAMFACCDVTDYLECILLSVLSDVLDSGEESVLRKAFVNSGKAVRLGGGYDDSSRATYFYLYAEGLISGIDFRTELNTVFEELIKEGVPRDKVKIAIDKLRFYLDERDFGYKPTGLLYGLELMKGLLYGNNDFEPMRIKELLDKAENADYEALVSKYFLGKGVYGHTVKAARNEITSDRPVNDAPLNRFRAQVNTPEMLKLIQPKSAKDIEARLRWFDYERTDGCIYIESDTDIVYLDLVYPLNTYIDNGLDKGYDFSALNFFCDVALKMDGELQEKSDRLFGRLSLDVDFCADTNNEKRERIIPYLALRTAFLEKNTAQCVDFINGFVQRLDFSDGEKLLRMANETYSTVSAAFRTSSQAFTMIRSMAAVRQSAMLGDYIAGVEYYNYLGTCIANPPQMSKILNYLKNTLPTAVLNCRAEVRDSILDGLKLGRVLPETLNYTLPLAKPCGYAVNTMVNSTAVAMPLDSYNGYMLVAEKIVQSSYLWEKLRLEGGAYGGACKFSRGHALSMYSYRDPQLERTVDAFKGVGKFLATLKLDEDELNRYIIGSAGDMLKPFKAKMINNTVLSQVLLDKSYEKELEYCQSMLSCTIKDINSIGEMVEQSTNDACYVTIGSENISSFYGDNVYKL